MTVTAATSACARAAWETITPRSSLIVLLEVLLDVGARADPLEELLVERRRRVHARVAQQLVQRDDFAADGDVLPRVEGDGDQRHWNLQQRRLLAIEAGAVVLARSVPVLQLYHNFDAYLLAHRPDAEQRLDVDQANAADLHVVARQLMAPTDQHVIPLSGDVHYVVGDEAMATLHQVEYALALADPGAALEQQSDPEHVRQGGVDRCGGREHIVQEGFHAAVELGRLELGPDDRDALGARQREQLGRRFLPLRCDHCLQVGLEERLEGVAPGGGIEGGEVGDLGFAEDV